jgi:hypothetical protein
VRPETTGEGFRQLTGDVGLSSGVCLLGCSYLASSGSSERIMYSGPAFNQPSDSDSWWERG